MWVFTVTQNLNPEVWPFSCFYRIFPEFVDFCGFEGRAGGASTAFPSELCIGQSGPLSGGTGTQELGCLVPFQKETGMCFV